MKKTQVRRSATWHSAGALISWLALTDIHRIKSTFGAILAHVALLLWSATPIEYSTSP